MKEKSREMHGIKLAIQESTIIGSMHQHRVIVYAAVTTRTVYSASVIISMQFLLLFITLLLLGIMTVNHTL